MWSEGFDTGRVIKRWLTTLLSVAVLATGCATSIDLEAQSASLVPDGQEQPDVVTAPTNAPVDALADAPVDAPTNAPADAPVDDDEPIGDGSQLGFRQSILITQIDVEAYWERRLPEVFGIDFEPVRTFEGYFPSKEVSLPSCGGFVDDPETYRNNAFYCYADDSISWDEEELLPDLFETFGDFAISLVLAHEYGHAIQNRTDQNGPTINIELQADCLAGAWAGTLARGESPNLVIADDDLEEAIGGFLVVRDALGTPADDPYAHGSAFDRATAFFDGFTGDAEACVDYDTDPPPIAAIALSARDFETGGNLPLLELIPLIQSELALYWPATLDAALSFSYQPPTWVSYGPTIDLSPCGGEVLDAEVYVDNVFYCSADNTLMFDEGNLLTNLWTEFGDGAAMYALTNASAQSALFQAGFDDLDGRLGLAAECLTGAFNSDLFLGAFENLVISAGDLDELIVGMSRYEPSGPNGQGRTLLDLSQRIDAVRFGFDEGVRACVRQQG